MRAVTITIFLVSVGLFGLAAAGSGSATALTPPPLPMPARKTVELAIDIHLDVRSACLALGDLVRMREHLHEAEVLGRALGDQGRFERITIFMGNQCLVSGDYAEAFRFGQEAVTIARVLGDRSLEAVAAVPVGMTHIARGELTVAVAVRPAFVLLCAGFTHFVTGRIDEAAGRPVAAWTVTNETEGIGFASARPEPTGERRGFSGDVTSLIRMVLEAVVFGLPPHSA
jgi:hypothetical protein